jgi:predicted ribosomally synthesized peptide with nif11-like leader
MAKDTADSASQLVDRMVNDAQFRESVEAAPTVQDKAQVIKAAGYGDVNLDDVRVAVKEQLRAFGAGVQVDPERVKRVEELYFKAASDQNLLQALVAAPTPEAKREVLEQAGYGDITLDDLRATATDLAQREELSDKELEQVSGGISDWGIGRFATSGTTAAMGATSIALATMYGTSATLGIVGLGIGLVGVAITAAIEFTPPVSQW